MMVNAKDATIGSSGLGNQPGGLMPTFDEQVQDHQSAWRETNVITTEWGGYGKGRHPWILPTEEWEAGLWSGIRSESANSLPDYLARNSIHRHAGSNNLKSSWILC